MKKIIFNSALAFALCFGVGCENKRTETTTETETTENTETTVPADENVGMETPVDSTKIVTGKPPVDTHNSDGEFVMKALSANKLEVQLGKIAAKKGTTAEVKNFGQKLVDDHARAFTE